jgi:hypothetical protein
VNRNQIIGCYEADSVNIQCQGIQWRMLEVVIYPEGSGPHEGNQNVFPFIQRATQNPHYISARNP